MAILRHDAGMDEVDLQDRRLLTELHEGLSATDAVKTTLIL